MNTALMLLAIGQVADVATTRKFLLLGLAEKNPVVRAMFGRSQVWIVVKVLLAAGAAALFRDSPWLWLAVALSWGAAAWNYRIIKRRQSQ